MRLVAALTLGLSTAIACGGAPPPKAPPKGSDATAARPKNTTSIPRARVKEAIARGLGYFLQEIALDDAPAMAGDRFHGFRIKAIPAEWRIDLRSGDVVTAVGGMPIERPEQADAAFRALANAKELRVDFEREGKPRTLSLPIEGD